MRQDLDARIDWLDSLAYRADQRAKLVDDPDEVQALFRKSDEYDAEAARLRRERRTA